MEPPDPPGYHRGEGIFASNRYVHTVGGKTMARIMYSPAHKKNVTRETDPYLPKKTAPSVSVCPECRAICRNKRWHLDEKEFAALTRKKGGGAGRRSGTLSATRKNVRWGSTPWRASSGLRSTRTGSRCRRRRKSLPSGSGGKSGRRAAERLRTNGPRIRNCCG